MHKVLTIGISLVQPMLYYVAFPSNTLAMLTDDTPSLCVLQNSVFRIPPYNIQSELYLTWDHCYGPGIECIII